MCVYKHRLTLGGLAVSAQCHLIMCSQRPGSALALLGADEAAGCREALVSSWQLSLSPPSCPLVTGHLLASRAGVRHWCNPWA